MKLTSNAFLSSPFRSCSIFWITKHIIVHVATFFVWCQKIHTKFVYLPLIAVSVHIVAAYVGFEFFCHAQNESILFIKKNHFDENKINEKNTVWTWTSNETVYNSNEWSSIFHCCQWVSFLNVGIRDKKRVAMLTQRIEIENRIKIYKNILLFTVILLSFCLFIKQQTSIFPYVSHCNFLCKVIFPRT